MKLNDRVLLSVAQMSRPKKRKGASHMARKCKTTEVENNPLRRRAAKASAHAAGARLPMMGGAQSASAEPRRRITVRKAALPVERREEQQSSGSDDPDREEPPTRRQRVAPAVVQLRARVATGKTDSDQSWGCNVVFDGGGFCDECITAARTVRARRREAGHLCCRTCTDRRCGQRGRSSRSNVVAGSLMDHQGVAYVTKILDTNEAVLTESGRRA